MLITYTFNTVNVDIFALLKLLETIPSRHFSRRQNFAHILLIVFVLL